MPKLTRKGLKRKCDKLWSDAVKKRDQGVCQHCYRMGANAHHIFTKGGHPSTRHDIENGIWLCVYCHRAIAHGKPQAFDFFVQKWLGQKRYDALTLRANTSGKSDMNLSLIELMEYLKG